MMIGSFRCTMGLPLIVALVLVGAVGRAAGDEADGLCTAAAPDSISCRWADAVAGLRGGGGGGGLRRVALIYYRPETLASGDVGLEKAVGHWTAATRRVVAFLNVADLEGARPAHDGELCAFLRRHFDHALVKSNWDYVVDTFVRSHLWARGGGACALTRSLQVAGSYPPPPGAALERFYDALYYETPWYGAAFLQGRHPRIFHAFGVDADAVAELCGAARDRRGRTAPAYDAVFVGAFADHAGFKRPTAIAGLGGRRLAIGKIRDNAGGVSEEARAVVDALTAAGVEVRDQIPWTDLFSILADASVVLVPDDWRGGGERAVLEARACGVAVEVLADNPKLRALGAGPVYTPLYYAGALEAGLLALEAALAAPVRAETCGVAALVGGDQCARSPEYEARVPSADLAAASDSDAAFGAGPAGLDARARYERSQCI